MADAQWTHGTGSTKRVNPDGTAEIVLPLLDDGEPMLTLRLTIDAKRKLTVLVEGEPGASLTGFEAWSDL